MSELIERKLKRERVEACLNCKRFVECGDIGRFEQCSSFEEVDGEALVIRRLGECSS